MKVSVMFTVAAIVLVLLGIVSFLAPAISALSMTDTSAAFSAKVSGVSMLSLGVIAWLAALIQAILAAGFFMAGRSSMSKSM